MVQRPPTNQWYSQGQMHQCQSTPRMYVNPCENDKEEAMSRQEMPQNQHQTENTRQNEVLTVPLL